MATRSALLDRNALGGMRDCGLSWRHLRRHRKWLVAFSCIMGVAISVRLMAVQAGGVKLDTRAGPSPVEYPPIPFRNSMQDQALNDSVQEAKIKTSVRTAGANTPGHATPSGYQQAVIDVGTPKTMPHTSFSFSRHDLRLQFRELAPVDSSDPFYDNKDRYSCTQTEAQVQNTSLVEDFWCMARPTYIQELKNPCFRRHGERRQPGREWNATTSLHCLPFFHILGVDKCGTTDFHARLMHHPQLLPNSGQLGKEAHFWSWTRHGLYYKELFEHKEHFPDYVLRFEEATHKIQEAYSQSKQQLITGDGTPMDFWEFRGWTLDPHNVGKLEPEVLTPHTMRHIYRDPRFFVLMRNPVDRMYSDYIFMSHGFSAEEFAEDVPVAIAMMRDCLKVNSTRQCFFGMDMYHRMPMRLHLSCYSIFLREWLSVFHRRHFFFLRTEDYQADMAASLKDAFAFLEVDPPSPEVLHDMASRTKVHQTVLKKTAGAILPETRKLLEEFYSPCNADLASLLGDNRFLWQDSRSNRTGG